MLIIMTNCSTYF